MSNKCPIDGRQNRPIFIIHNNKRVLALSDGLGDAYKIYGDSYMGCDCVCKIENKYDPNDYEFERGLGGMDF